MITQANLNKLTELERLVSYDGQVTRLISALTTGSGLEQLDRYALHDFANAVQTLRNKMSSMKKKYEDVFRKQNEVIKR